MHVKKQQIAVMIVAAGLVVTNARVRAQEAVPTDQGRPSVTERDTPPLDAEASNRPACSRRADTVTELRGYSRPSRTFERETAEDSLEREPVRAVQGNGARQLITHPDHANLFEEPLFGKAPADKSGVPATDTSDETMEPRAPDSLRHGRPSRTFERETAEDSLEREPVRAVQGNGARQLITHPDHANLFEEPLFGKAPGDKSGAPATDTSDETMQQRISDSLQQISTPGSPQTVSVTVQNGTVTLRGTVANDAEKRNIETTVKQMSGVRRVNNQLKVQSR